MLGLITEYNPFHNGHKLHIEKSKEITNSKNCIVVMSGNFVQRGEPAIFDKYLRTKMALLNGADLVIELPLIFATSSAELFALGSVDLLDKTGIVTDICFGSESGNLKDFLQVSNILSNEPPLFKKLLLKELNSGISFPKARANALKNMISIDLDFLNSPNNILSIEYLKALNALNSNISPNTIKREKSQFHSTTIQGNIASATALRKAFLHNNVNDIKSCIPKNCFSLIEKYLPYNPPSINEYSQILSYILRTKSIDDIKNIADINEGIENKIIDNIDKNSISCLLESIKSKRYTYSRLQRALLHILLNITNKEQLFLKKNLNQYIRILGFKKSSSYILKALKENSKIPIITNLKNANSILNQNSMYYLNKEIKSSDIYYLNQNKKLNQEYKEPLVII